MPEITRDEVAHLARLARLALHDDELDRLAGQLDVILGAVAQIAEVAARATSRRRATPCPVVNVTRPDVVTPQPRPRRRPGRRPRCRGRAASACPRILDEEA